MKMNVGKNTLLNIIGQGIPILVALFAIPVAIHHLGDARFGILTIAWLIIGASTMFDLGMGRATTKFIADAVGREETEKIPTILSSAVFVQLLLGLLGAVGIAGLAPFLAGNVFTIPAEYLADSRYMLVLAGVSIPIALITGSYLGLLEATHRFDLVNVFRVIFSSLTYLSPLIGIIFGWGLVGIVALLLFFRLLQLIAIYKVCAALHPAIGWMPQWNRDQFRLMFGFGGWVALSNILSPLQENMERLMLASLLPIARLTYYSVPKEMLERIYILPGSLASALFPTISIIAVSRRSDLSALFRSAIKAVIISVSLLLFPIAVLADQLLTIWINKDFATISTPVVQVLVLGVMASALNSLAMTLFQGVGRPDITAKQQLVRFPIIAAAAWFLISYYGLVGAAASWSFGRVLALGMNCWAIVKILDWKVRELFTWHIGISLIAPFALAVMYFIIGYWVEVAAKLHFQVLLAGIGMLTLAAISWRYVLTHDERGLAHVVITNGLQRLAKAERA